MALDEVFDYFRKYDKRTFEVVACQGFEPSEADVAAFEAEVGFGLPGENAHAPNEWMSDENFVKGAKAVAAFWDELATVSRLQ